MKIARRRAVLASGIAALALLGLTSTANAAAESALAASDRRDVCFTGACGSGTITYYGPGKTYADVALSVNDTACDNHNPKIRIREYGFGGGGTSYTNYGSWHVNTKGCHGGYASFNGLSFEDVRGIYAIAVEICNNGTCRVSGQMVNPYW
ncbi:MULTISPECIES: hypothetical protein [unclassified Streptomyces]|uniref:hypothetical protein n=1 Tax=unclassified Streptomyces TaxID=2593676 RepID=UPI003819847F